MKILLTGEYKLESSYGGGQVYVRNLIESFLVKKHDVSYMSIAFADVPSLKRLAFDYNGIKEFQIMLPAGWLKKINTPSESCITEEITNFIKRLNPDVIHSNGWKRFVCLGGKKAGIPCVITAHHGGIVCPVGTLLNADDEICQIPASDDNCLKCCVKEVPGWRLVYPLIKVLPLKFRLSLGPCLRRLPFILFLTPLGTMSYTIQNKMKEIFDIGQNASAIIAPSYSIMNALVRNGIPEKKITNLLHGIPLPKRYPAHSDLMKRAVNFIYVGRINRIKGIHVMLKAFSDLSPEKYKLHIIGGAYTKLEQRYLKKLLKQYSAVNAIWHGVKTHDETMQYIAKSDVLIHPTIALEAFGLTVAEALAIGRPVIATRCGGADEQIHDNLNGFLVQPNNPVELTNKINFLLDNPTDIIRLTSNIEQVISIEEHISDLCEIYHSLL